MNHGDYITVNKLRTSKFLFFSYFLAFTALAIGLAGVTKAETITQAFYAEEQLALGTIVSLDRPEASTVVKATPRNINNLYGVIVQQGDISVSQDNSRNQVFVANEGVANVLVSTANGSVNAGDAITVKSIEGIGEKSSQEGIVLGIAQQDLENNNNELEQYTIGENSSNKNISIGLIPVHISVGSYSDIMGSTGLEDRNALEQVADGLAGKRVKLFALVLSFIVLLIGIFASIFIITSSSYGSIISMGRNPLSEKKIVRSLLLLFSMAIGFFASSALIAYLILRILG